MGKILKFQPIFLPKIWGGNHISKMKKWNSPIPQNCGEVWLVSDVSSQQTLILNTHQTLSELIQSDHKNEFFSSSFRSKYKNFPLLIKIIDAREDLSIQVHPNDEIALRKHNSLGKSESWIILDHEKDASLYLGWKKQMTLQEIQIASQEGWIDDEINQIKVKKNDLFYIPAGLVHSIGKGIVLGEIQQSSDVTYRLFDFNRKDSNGKLRELHLEDSLEAVSLEKFSSDFPNSSTIVSNYFSYSIHTIDANQSISISNNQLLWLTEGEELILTVQDETMIVQKHEPIWIPNSIEKVTLMSNSSVTFLTIQIP
jgi:mannose-6-phosphate isomerase